MKQHVKKFSLTKDENITCWTIQREFEASRKLCFTTKLILGWTVLWSLSIWCFSLRAQWVLDVVETERSLLIIIDRQREGNRKRVADTKGVTESEGENVPRLIMQYYLSDSENCWVLIFPPFYWTIYFTNCYSLRKLLFLQEITVELFQRLTVLALSPKETTVCGRFFLFFYWWTWM